MGRMCGTAATRTHSWPAVAALPRRAHFVEYRRLGGRPWPPPRFCGGAMQAGKQPATTLGRPGL